MTIIDKSALVLHTPEQMFRVVDGISAYPEYLPWCVGTEELKRDDELVEARIDINHSGFKKSFSTRNKIVNNSIEMELLEGPFKYLTGLWTFEAIGHETDPQGCKVTLHLEFEFNSKIVGMTFGKVFGKIASSMVDSFTERADKIYNNATA